MKFGGDFVMGAFVTGDFVMGDFDPVPWSESNSPLLKMAENKSI